MIFFLLLLLSCGTGEEPTEPVIEPEKRPEAVVIDAEDPEKSPGIATVVPGGAAVPVQLLFFNISSLHKGFFSQREIAARLGKDLGLCTEHAVEIQIRYDNQTRVGWIVAVIPPDTLTCLPEIEAGAVNMTPLEPVGRALAGYRNRVAGSSDLRINSFRVGVQFTRGLKACRFKLAGQHPPDGSSWSPCVSFAGEDHCASGDRNSGVTSLLFGGEDLRYAAACVES